MTNLSSGGLKIKNYLNKYQGKRCFIIGNGPSLNKCDLSLLEGEYTFGVNGIFYKTRECGFIPTFYVVEDGHVVDDNLIEIAAYEAEHKFTLARYADKFDESSRMQFLNADLGFYNSKHHSYQIPRFSLDCAEVVYCGQSVTYINLQLAYYMGFTEIYLIGMDFSYSVPQSTKIDGCTFTSQEDDPNHFHPDYFGQGKKWHDPKVDLVGLNYQKAKEVFELDGRKIFNATIGGKLDIFCMVEYGALFCEGPMTGNKNQVVEGAEEIVAGRLLSNKKVQNIIKVKYTPPVSSDWSTKNDKLPPAISTVFSFFSHCGHIIKDSIFGASGIGFGLIFFSFVAAAFVPEYRMPLIVSSKLLVFAMLLLFVVSFVGQKFREAVEDIRSKRRRDIYSLSSFCVDTMNQLCVTQADLQKKVELLQAENSTLKSSITKISAQAEESIVLAHDSAEQLIILCRQRESDREAGQELRDAVNLIRTQLQDLNASFTQGQDLNLHTLSLLEGCFQNHVQQFENVKNEDAVAVQDSKESV